MIPTKYHKHPSIVKAKQEELDKWIKYEAYIEVNEVENMKLITMRWVVMEKGKGEKLGFVLEDLRKTYIPCVEERVCYPILLRACAHNLSLYDILRRF